MKKGIHPESREILFVDRSANFVLKTRSTLQPKDTYEYEGKEYPVMFVETSSASHPFYTGEQRKTANEGRVASFNKRFGAFANRGKK